MRYGLPLSIVFHGLLLAAVMIGWPSFSKPVTEQAVDVPVEIVMDDQLQPPQGKKLDPEDERKEDEDTKSKKIERPEKAPEPRQADVKKPTDSPDKAPVTPKAEAKPEAPPAPTAPPAPPKREVKKPSESPNPSTPKAERESAAPSRPAAPPAPKEVPVPQPRSAEKAPATPDSERRPTEVKKPPAPPEPNRDQASLRPPPRVTTPEPSKAPDRPDADRDGAEPERPQSAPKSPERPSATLRPPGAAERKAEEPRQDKPQITNKPEAPPQRAEPDKKEGSEQPRITGRPSEPPSPRETPRAQAQPSAKPDTVQPKPDRSRSARQPADAERASRDKPGVPNSTVLTHAQREAVVRKIRECWNVDRAAKDMASLVVVIEVTMNEDGTVRDAVVSNETRGLGNSTVRAFAESARRALLNPKCQPLPFPRGRYEEWKRFKAEFDPADI